MRQRIHSIDMLRGLVMVIMALDHVRDFLHYPGEQTESLGVALDPTNLATTTPVLFFTRWITHFCAPVFIFLSGMSAYLASRRRTPKEAALFLIKRGVWLILLEITVVSFSWSFDPGYRLIFLQVIWVIGASMVILGILSAFARPGLIFALGLLIVCGHNLLNLFPPSESFRESVLGYLSFHALFSYIPLDEKHGLVVVYALIPWLGVMCLGFGFGRWYSGMADTAARSRKLVQVGLLVTLCFIVLRAINIYGDPVPWTVQSRGGLYTVLSFFNTNKYPPSLLYLAMTLGPALMFLGVLEKAQIRATNPFVVVGRVPLFYYILHFYLLHLMAVVIFYAKGFGADDIVNPGVPFNFIPPGLGFGLPGVYLCWILLVAMLYPLCAWYNRFKSTHDYWWLSYV
jgi:uncharacterized membrane protein